MFTRRILAEEEQNRLKMPMAVKKATKSAEKAMRSFFARSLRTPEGFEAVEDDVDEEIEEG